MTKISVFDEGNLKSVFTKVISAKLTNTLSGECTFEFSVTSAMATDISTGMSVELTGDGMDFQFNIVRISKALSSGMTICTVTCEHKSYELNDPEYDLSAFEFEGEPAKCLELLLDGTALAPGICDISLPVELKINQECSRRAALMQLIALCGGEIEYSGNRINIRSHRGSEEYREIMDGKNISDLTLEIDKRSNTFSYGLTLYKKLDFGVGDNVHIVFHQFYLDVLTRIIGMSYSPFNRREISIDVGDYVPSIADNLYRIEKAQGEVKQNVDDATAQIKTDTNDDEITVSGVSQEIIRLSYNALKSTYSAFCATIKMVVSSAGTVIFILKKDENEVMRYPETVQPGEYARTYTYPFTSDSGLNSLSFWVVTNDGAAVKLPKMQSWGYIMGAYMAGDNPWDGFIRMREIFGEFQNRHSVKKTLVAVKEKLLCDFPEYHKRGILEKIPTFVKTPMERKTKGETIREFFPTSWSPVITTPPPLTAVNTSNRELYIVIRNPVKASGEIIASAFTMIVTAGISTIELQPVSARLDELSLLDGDEIGSMIRLKFGTSVMQMSTQNITVLYDSTVGNLIDAFNSVKVQNFQTSFIYIPYEDKEDENGS